MADPSSLPPLFSLLQTEAQAHGQRLNPSDAKFADKVRALSARVPREYEVLQVFRAFLADPQHPACFWFPDRYDKYRKLMAEARTPPAQKAEPMRCPRCKTTLLPEGSDGLLPCNHCRTWYRLFNGRLEEASVEAVAFTAIPSVHSSGKHEAFPEGAE